MNNVMTRTDSYVLGHSNTELERLIKQASFYGVLSEQALRMAGIAPGMRVLDVGCGSGDVSFLAASLVGPNGSVTGIDKGVATIELASQRAVQANITNVRFEVGDIMQYQPNEKVDIVVGRLILIHLPDPVAALRHLSSMLKPGGIILFEEVDITTSRSVPTSALFSNTIDRLTQTFRRAGLEPDTGSHLYSLFNQAGLPQPQMIGGARVEGGPASTVYEYLAETVRSMLPFIIKTGVATAEEIEIDTFVSRLRHEITEMGGIIVTPTMISAWARLP